MRGFNNRIAKLERRGADGEERPLMVIFCDQSADEAARAELRAKALAARFGLGDTPVDWLEVEWVDPDQPVRP